MPGMIRPGDEMGWLWMKPQLAFEAALRISM
jgi:hypothetical protein